MHLDYLYRRIKIASMWRLIYLGLDPKDIELSYDKGMLLIHGERSEKEEDKRKKYL
jgi:hypothetical protein